MAELERGDEVAGDAFVRSRRPGAVEPRRPRATDRLRLGKATRAASAERGAGAASAPAGGAEGWQQTGGNDVQGLHVLIVRNRDARVARGMSGKRQALATRPAMAPTSIASGASSAPESR